MENILHRLEQRGLDFFDTTIRLTNIQELMRGDKVRADFEQNVLADIPQQIEEHVRRLIDWLVQKDLQEWQALHQRRPGGDKHSAAFESITEGIHQFPGGFLVTTTADAFLNWARKSSIWPVTFGLACCAIEMMATFASRFDVERLGMVPWASPRHSDLMIISGTVTIKMAPMLTRIYDQMPDPKWAVSMGSCANSGGPFRHGYHVVKGVDRVIPVDVYVPGCPPPPESLLNGLLLLQDHVAHFRRTGRRAEPSPKVD